MKYIRLLLFAAILGAWTAPVPAADAPAPLSIDQALKIAQDYLQQHGATDRQVTGLTLERATFRSVYWYARWSAPIGDGPKKETGLRIDMDGSITRFISGPSELPPGQRRIGARDLRGG